MFENDFWTDADVISVYDDADAIDDGILIDCSNFEISFNRKTVNRITIGARCALDCEAKDFRENKRLLARIAGCALFDGEGEDAWGIVQTLEIAANKRFWLIPNERRGYTLMLPSEY